MEKSQENQYLCITCGNEIIEQKKSPKKMLGKVCVFSGCKNRIQARFFSKEFYQCKDSKKKFCSKEHFKKVYGLFCFCCGREVPERMDYLEKIRSKKTVLQRTLHWVVGCLMVLIVVLVIMMAPIFKH